MYGCKKIIKKHNIVITAIKHSVHVELRIFLLRPVFEQRLEKIYKYIYNRKLFQISRAI